MLTKESFFLALGILAIGSRLFALQIDPELLHFQSLPDETLKGSFHLTNDESTTLNLAITISDWKYDAQGRVLMVTTQGQSHSLKNWLNVDLSPITLGPGKSFDLPVQLKVPEVVFGSHSTGVLLQGNKVYWALVVHSVLGSVEKLSLDNLEYQIKPRSIHLSFKLSNAGEVFTGVSGYVALISETGLVVGKRKLEPVSFFPEQARLMQVELPLELALKEGQYYFRFVFQAEGEAAPLLKIEKPLLRQSVPISSGKPTPNQMLNQDVPKAQTNLKWNVLKATLQATGRKNLKAYFQIANQEDFAISPSGLITVFDSRNRKVFSGNIPTKTILAGYSDLLIAKWNLPAALRPGQYTAQVRFLYQNATLEVRTNFKVE